MDTKSLASTVMTTVGAGIAFIGLVATIIAFGDLAGRRIDGQSVAPWVLLGSVAPVAAIAVLGLILSALGVILDRLE